MASDTPQEIALVSSPYEPWLLQVGIRKYLATGFNAYDPANPDRKLMDSVCQAAAETSPAASQTTWFRRVHASVQYTTMHHEPEEVQQK